MTNLERLIKQLEQQWKVSAAEACQWLIGAIGKAINTPLAGIKLGSGVLKLHAASAPV